MIPESLIRGIVRDISRRYLSFANSPTDASLPNPSPKKKYLLYLHIPFCVVLCPFCSFHRVLFKQDRTTNYFESLRSEIRHVSEAGFHFSELYVGGGTPTVMPDELTATVKLVRDLHAVSKISAETNPDDLDDHRLPLLHEAGVSRLSVGVQSFDDGLLREMQRYEKYGSGAQIIERLKRVKGQFDTLNIDMIFNFPHQTETSLQNDLQILTDELGAEQVSFYPLMTTDSTRRPMLQKLGVTDYQHEKLYYELIVRHMLAAGYTRSSAWCFSRRTGVIDEYITQQDEYLGLGSGAFSFLDGSIYSSTFSINHYMQLIEQGKIGIVRRRAINQADQMRYFLLMRLFSGSLDLQTAEHMFAGQFCRTLRKELVALRLLGAVKKSAQQLILTERGFYIWVMMMREFFTGVNNLREEMRHNISSETGILSTG